MGANCAPLVANLFLFCYERDFMTSFSDDNKADIIEAFNSTYRGPLLLIYIYLFLTILFPPKFMINAMTLILIL